jgi:sulfate permease, SulP family
MHSHLTDWFPILRWSRGYGRQQLAGDLTASTVVTLLLIPQSLAYAVLAGMPPVTGLYASIVPMVVYALMCSSTVLGPGPSALRSIMSLAAVGAVVGTGSADFVAASAVLAVMVGLALLVMGGLRMGFMASFLSQPVLSGFITASGLLIAMSQLKHVLGTPVAGDGMPTFLRSLAQHLDQIHGLTLAVGVSALALLWATRRWLRPALGGLGVPEVVADLVAKASPLLVLLLSIVLTTALDWPAQGLAVVGDIPQGLPSLVLAPLLGVPASTVQALVVPALLVAVMTFIEQISIAQGLAAKRRERVDVNAEMRAMGGANLAAGLTGAFAVGASFARTAVVAESGGHRA